MKSFSPVSSNKLYIQIYNQIHDAIISGQYEVGDRLPSEKDLCAMFNVSRVPVREALSALELNGLVDSMQGAGVYVKRTTPEKDDWTHEVEPQDIIRARMVLEPDIARLAAEQINEEQRAELRDIIERFKEEADEDVYTTTVDKEFHLFLAKTSGNTLYVMMMEMVFKTMEQRMWELILSRTVATKKYREQNNREHLHIAQAVLDGRADDAYAFMKDHMEQLYERYWS
ncbi:MAG: FadR family transcriptional regulator [Oscillospiraceae bacterium]|nr:FadR family transcriptional regulator [Oscillospiraceae bacterium]